MLQLWRSIMSESCILYKKRLQHTITCGIIQNVKKFQIAESQSKNLSFLKIINLKICQNISSGQDPTSALSKKLSGGLKIS